MLELKGLGLSVEGRSLIKSVNLHLESGEVLGVIGPSGAGKSSLARAVAGLLSTPDPFQIQGSILFDGQEVCAMSAVARSRAVVLVPQGAEGALPQYHSIQDLVPVLAGDNDPAGALKNYASVLCSLGVTDPARILASRSSELSGGERTRALLAFALIGRPRLLVLDEPTAGLDQENRTLVVEAIRAARRDFGCAFLVISHDVQSLAQLTSRLLKVAEGEAKILHLPPRGSTSRNHPMRVGGIKGAPILELRNASVRIGGLEALSSTSLSIGRGERLGITGPSGSGKSTLARVLAGLVRPTGGVVCSHFAHGAGSVSIRRPNRQVQLLHQHPQAAFDPRLSLHASIALAAVGSTRSIVPGLDELAARLGLSSVTLALLPAQASGGEAQRAALLRAMLCNPRVLICDEPTESLDQDSAAAVERLLDETVAVSVLTLIVISHDVSMLARLCDRTVRLPLYCD